MLCARECPDWCIYIDSHKETIPAPEGGRPRQRNVLDRFAIDFSLCMYCGICIEVCPFDALFWSPEFEYAEGDIRNLIHEKDKLAAWTQTVPPPPAHDPGAEPPKELTAAPRRPAARTARTAEPPQRRGTAASPSPATPKTRPAAGADATSPAPEASGAQPATGAKSPHSTTRAERPAGVSGTTSEAGAPRTTSEAGVPGTASETSVPETMPEAGESGTMPGSGTPGTEPDTSATGPDTPGRGPDTAGTTPSPDAQAGEPTAGAPGSGPATAAPSRAPGGRQRRPIQNVRGIRPPGALPSRAKDDTPTSSTAPGNTSDAPSSAFLPEEGQTITPRPAGEDEKAPAPTTEEDDTAGVASTAATTSSPTEVGETGPFATEPPQGQASSTGQPSQEKLSTASGVPQPKPEPEEQTSAASPRRRRMADPRSIRPPGRLGPDETRESEEES
ncbi:4Fe-4S binding protein [Nonomuraea angiospora]